MQRLADQNRAMSLSYNNLMGALRCHDQFGWGRKPIQTIKPLAKRPRSSDLRDRVYILLFVPRFGQSSLEFASTAIAF